MYRGSKYQQNAKHSHTFLTNNGHKGSLVKHNVRTTLLKYGSEGPALINSYGEADDAFQENNQSIVTRRMKNLSREHYMREKSIDYWTLWALVLLIGGGTHHYLWMLISSQSLF